MQAYQLLMPVLALAISAPAAYADALAILTPDQRARATARFAAADYQLPEELQPRAAGAEAAATEPLRHLAADDTPVGQGTKSADSVKDPLQHRDGQAPLASTPLNVSFIPASHPAG